MEQNIKNFLEVSKKSFFSDKIEGEIVKSSNKILKILLIEDDEFIIELILDELKEEPYNGKVLIQIARTISDLEQILEEVENGIHFDYAFLDGKLGKDNTGKHSKKVVENFETYSISACVDLQEIHLQNGALKVIEKIGILGFLEDRIKENEQ